MARSPLMLHAARPRPRKYSITRIYWGGLVFLALLPTLSLGYLWINDQYRAFQQQSEEIRDTYEQLQSRFLRHKADDAVDYINFKSLEIDQRLLNELKSYVDNAVLVLESQDESLVKNRRKLLHSLSESIGQVKFDAGNGHYLLLDEKGRSLIPVVSGTNGNGSVSPDPFRDQSGADLIGKLLKKARNSGDASVSAWLPEQASSPNTYSAQLYLRYYPAMNVYIGAIGYEEDMVEEAQAEVLDRLRAQSRERDMFITVLDYDGNVILAPDGTGEGSGSWVYSWDRDGAAGELLARLRDSGKGSNLKLRWSQRRGAVADEYLSYAHAAPAWHWIAIANSPLATLESQIARRHAEVREGIQRDIATVALVVVGLMIFATLGAKRLAMQTRRALSQFNQFFAESDRQNTRIDIDKVPLLEFEQLALDANRMLDHRLGVERELIAARIAAEEANQAKSQFLSTMSHELRTPLNGVLGYAQILIQDPALNASQHRHLAAIRSCGEHLLTLINDVLDLAKIESGEIEVIERQCRLYPLLTATADVVRGKAEAKGLAFTLDVAADVPTHVWLDDAKLRQILINLLGNAVKFTQVGSVTLSARVDKAGQLVLEVSDTGIGIDRKRLHEIFHPFRQLLSHSGGTGLGLAISHQVCAAMGGTLHVDSALGAGSRFTVSLPLKVVRIEPGEELAHDAERAIVDFGAEHLRIMVVDDNEDNRLVLSSLLRSVGVEIVEAEHGLDAIEKLRAQPVPLVLMDLRMPVMDGIEATRRIKADTSLRDTTVIAVSATVLPEAVQQMRDVGCADFITKPIHLHELLDKISRCLGVSLRVQSPARESAPDSSPAALQVPKEVQAELHAALVLGDLEAMYSALENAENAGSMSTDAVGRLRMLLDNFEIEAVRELLSGCTESA